MVVGYYVSCDDAVCVDCAGPESDFVSAWRADGGFESWDAPLAISSWDEADCPTHCCECDSLIAHDLTDEGVRYVIEAACESRTRHSAWSAHVVASWVREYLPQRESLADRLDARAYALAGGPIINPAH